MSTVDAAGTLNSFVAGMLAKALDDLYVCFSCRIVSFHAESGTAVIQPLLRTTDKEPALIQNVPVLGHKYIVKEHEQTVIDQETERTITVKEHEQIHVPNLQPGDIALAVCADKEIRNTLSGQVATPLSKRTHSKNDAVIVGVMPCSLLSL
ncbi:hypothetical protein [Paenibacillus piri]|uniref:Phage protein Gp138 N-terminal domain-containing protein n=1 Tax=Paenibacillus piri TaxID=2547395 RepID=A0A4R5KAK4_9BACL|nr:hypothetical protein [Paenibacillus piri]TDF92161.1 hypothetical protein E1757_30670 [Paenibacillus piri]